MSIPPTPGARVRWTRKRRGLSYRALAKRAGVTPSTVQKWELATGFMQLRTTEKVAEVLGVSPEWIAFGRPRRLDETARDLEVLHWLQQEDAVPLRTDDNPS